MLYLSHLTSMSLLILAILITLVKANLVVVECKFPCADDGDVCEVTDSYVQCKPRTNNTKWILKDTMSLPEYQGPLIQLNQPCIIAPHPRLRNAIHLSKNTSETCIEWPLNDAYDSYFSNCARGLFCDRAHICVKQLTHGEVCESDNQCIDGNCSDHTCVEKAKKISSQGSSTLHIIASVIGVTVFLVVVVCAYLFARRQLSKKKLNLQKNLDKEQPATLSKTSTNAMRSNSSSSNTSANSASTTSSTTFHSGNYPSINMLHPAYDPHFQQDISRTPTMQQQQLQYQLQRQMFFNKANSRQTQENFDFSPSVAAPPPYSP
ncbi:hypothetical protein BD408DRAFT_441540 [Parasitella parasitica]|nr:hypothetical protein BD408DRAFT_441540 [Parasitella parasitica]